MKNIYVSASWNDALIVSDMYKKLDNMGHNITRRWADNITTIDTENDLATEAALVKKAILEADLIILYVSNDNYPYRGLTYEIGLASGMNKQMIMINNLPDNCYTMENMAIHLRDIRRVSNFDNILDIISI
jgi:hypothetical protein